MRRTNLKVFYKIRNRKANEITNGKTNVCEDKTIVTKITKIHENNLYSNIMTKPLPTCVIIIKKITTTTTTKPSLYEFNLLIYQIFDKDKIGHLFIVDKTMLLNEIYTPIFENEKVINPKLR